MGSFVNKENKKLNILVCNDDGVDYEGFRLLIEAVSPLGNVYAAAPTRNRPASSGSVSLGTVHFEEGKLPSCPWAERIWKVHGTPVDAYTIAMSLLEKEGIKIDLVCAGINPGENVGRNILYSGTLAMCMNANIDKIPSIALSLQGPKYVNLSTAQEVARQIICNLDREFWGTNILNVNIPDLAYPAIKGVKFTYIGDQIYEEYIDKGKLTRTGKVKSFTDNIDSDSGALAAGYVSVTPMIWNHSIYPPKDTFKEVEEALNNAKSAPQGDKEE
jgi:5'-nucleotidase